MKQTIMLVASCVVFCGPPAFGDSQVAAPSVACLGQGAESYLHELLTRVGELERQLDEERRARLAERTEFNRLLEKTRAEDRARFESVTTEIRSQCAAPNPAREPEVERSSRRETAPSERVVASATERRAAPNVPPAPPPDTALRRGDRVTIRVANAKGLDRTVAVTPAGTVELPMVGSLPAAGKTPAELVERLTERLSTFVKHPEVDVVAHRRDESAARRR